MKHKKVLRKQEKVKQAVDYFNQIIEKNEPDKAILNMLIDKIYIYHDKSAKFELKIKNCIQNYKNIIEYN